METNVNYTIVGIFVISLLCAIILGILWLSGGLVKANYKTYEVFMKESISGLSLNSTVKYNGVDVGDVKSITFNKDNPRIVELLLNVKDDTPITRGTRATLKTQGVTGIMFLALNDDGTDLDPLQTHPGQRYPVIQTSPSLFMQLDSMLTEITNALKRTATTIDTLFDAENQRAIKQTLISLQDITKNLSANKNQINHILESTELSIQMLNNEILPLSNQTMSNLNSIAKNLLDVSDELKQNPSIFLRGKTTLPLGPGEK